ncbi:hypothetical protein REPUB_Repub07fG0004800 [Reevesia pubescens]
MEASTSHDPEQNSAFHAPLLDRPYSAVGPAFRRRPLKGFVVIFASVVFLLSLATLIINQSQEQLPTPNKNVPPSSPTSKPVSFSKALPRGVAEGVSAKSNPSLLNQASFNWTNAMFSWQRTAYHFQPVKNWMNGR